MSDQPDQRSPALNANEALLSVQAVEPKHAFGFDTIPSLFNKLEICLLLVYASDVSYRYRGKISSTHMSICRVNYRHRPMLHGRH